MRPEAPLPRLLSLQAAAAETGIPVNSLRDLVSRGHLPVVRLPESRRVWIHPADLARLIERSRERSGEVAVMPTRKVG